MLAKLIRLMFKKPEKPTYVPEYQISIFMDELFCVRHIATLVVCYIGTRKACQDWMDWKSKEPRSSK